MQPALTSRQQFASVIGISGSYSTLHIGTQDLKDWIRPQVCLAQDPEQQWPATDISETGIRTPTEADVR